MKWLPHGIDADDECEGEEDEEGEFDVGDGRGLLSEVIVIEWFCDK